MKEISKREVSPKKVREDRSLKAKERNLAREVAEKKELSIQEKLDKEIERFESIARKEMMDYDLFLLKLQSIRDDLEYKRDTSDGDTSKIDKEIGRVDKLIEKYKKEQFDVCMQRSDDILDRVQKVLRE